MTNRGALVGRETELTELEAALDRARLGAGSLVLLAGEAGVGKTRLAETLAERADADVLRGRAARTGAAPYGPVVAALRSYLRRDPDGLAAYGPLRPHLALLLPELGEGAASADAATVAEAVRGAFAHLAAAGPLLLLLDDLQWSDDATLELIPALAEVSMLTVAGYRSDGLPRDHALRRLRHELRRLGRLHEIALAPLGLADTTELLADILDTAPPPARVRAIHERARGVPFLVEELARGTELTHSGEVPETIRDAVLLRAADLSPEGRAAAEAAAVAGEVFELEVIAALASADGLHELVDHGLVHEDGLGRVAFRHALTRDALYADVPWLQRRILHRRLAEALEARSGSAIEVATHWLGARNEPRARKALVRAAHESRAVHAHRDAARVAKQALELWPADDEQERRVALLEDFADSAQLAGDLADASAAWRELAALRTGEALATAQRRLAALHDLRDDRDAAAGARRAAADAFAAAGRPAEAAVERLALADYLRNSSQHAAAIELARTASEEGGAAERLDLRARALGLEGLSTALGGDYESGLATVQAGLALALEHGLNDVAAELYQRLSMVLYDSADYRRAQETLDTALGLCRAGDLESTELACVTCMVYVLRECGDWTRAMELGQELITEGRGVWVCEGLIGVIHALQGELGTARRLLSSCLASATRLDHFHMTLDSTAGLARVAAVNGASDDAAALCRRMLADWERSEDHHIGASCLRWATGFFARSGDHEGAHACAEALTRIASTAGHPDALAALAYAIGETALADGDAATAAEQLNRAVDLHRDLEIPYERAEISVRAGVALAAAGEREPALERLCAAYRTARKLGAKPLAAEAARAVAELGESVDQRLGRRAAADAAGAGLSRRELEVVRLVGAGRTNRQIAQELYLSKRTVDMHVHNVLRKLDVRSRLEAARRADELGLLA
jgi:DNA-binding CsgD family transcriptional regulator